MPRIVLDVVICDVAGVSQKMFSLRGSDLFMDTFFLHRIFGAGTVSVERGGAIVSQRYIYDYRAYAPDACLRLAHERNPTVCWSRYPLGSDYLSVGVLGVGDVLLVDFDLGQGSTFSFEEHVQTSYSCGLLVPAKGILLPKKQKKVWDSSLPATVFRFKDLG